MDRFLSHTTHRLDGKGRVSVPSSFRAVLARDGYDGLLIHPALDATALDAGGNALLAEIELLLSDFPRYSEARDHLSTALLGLSEILRLDGEGRIALPPGLVEHAGLTDAVTFVGLGHKFQLWEPERFRDQLAAARARVRELRPGFAGSKTETSPGARHR